MNLILGQLTAELVRHFEGDHRRIQHAVRVLHHSLSLLDERGDCDEDIVIAAALLHDVGIKPAEAVHGRNDGPLQEQYGPPVADTILRRINFPEAKRQTVLDIIGNHHSPARFDYPELALLKDADRIVNKAEAAS